MKNEILCYALLIPFYLLLGCAEDKTEVPATEIPSAVTATFNTRYPNATDARWEKKKVNDQAVYEAEFKMNGKDKEAKIDETGLFVGDEND